MITKRIIPCLDVRDGRVVKGVNFLGVRDVSDPVKLAQYYSESGADELVFYDITATVEGRALFTDILTRVAETIFIPLTVGGGIQTLADFDRVLKCGADKVSVNSGALRDPDLIRQGAERYGNARTRDWTPSTGSAGASTWAQVRSFSTPSTPTASSRALTLLCWTLSARPSTCRSSPPAGQAARRTLSSFSRPCPGSTLGLPPLFSTLERSPSLH